MKKTSFLIAAAAVMTVATGTAARAEAVPEETTAPVPAISVSEDGELSFAPEFQRFKDNGRIRGDS